MVPVARKATTDVLPGVLGTEYLSERSVPLTLDGYVLSVQPPGHAKAPEVLL